MHRKFEVTLLVEHEFSPEEGVTVECLTVVEMVIDGDDEQADAVYAADQAKKIVQDHLTGNAPQTVAALEVVESE